MSDPKYLDSEVEVHGNKTTYEKAVADGLMLVNVDANGVIVHVEIINPDLPGYVTEGTIVEGALAGTTFKQS